MKIGTRVIVTGIHKEDCRYDHPEEYVDMTGTVSGDSTLDVEPPGLYRFPDKRTYNGWIRNDADGFEHYFYRVYVKVLKEN